MRTWTLIGMIFGLLLMIHGCHKEPMGGNADVRLRFSTENITFDTLFTAIGSVTKNLRVINTSNDQLVLSTVRLAGGEKNGFHLNINGEATNESHNVVIPAHDSIFIFIQATLNKTGVSSPTITRDSILFRVNNLDQSVQLVAWGQDFNLVNTPSLRSTIWTKERPYLVMQEVLIDSTQTLQIEAGTKIYFHKQSGLKIKGNLIVKGSVDEPVEFSGDRLEPAYAEAPDQWNGIMIFSGSLHNKIDHAIIRNANTGLQVGSADGRPSAVLELSNTRIEHMSWAGIWALNAQIVGYNCLVADVRYYAVALLLGGDYQFYHSTFANYYNNLTEGIRSTETLIVSNYLNDYQTGVRIVQDLKGATFGNCIITGNRANELLLAMDGTGLKQYLFDRTLIQISDTFKLPDPNRFTAIIRNVNPRFKDPYHHNFDLDTLSICKDFGRITYGTRYPTDLRDKSRMEDAGPDLGALERKEGKR